MSAIQKNNIGKSIFIDGMSLVIPFKSGVGVALDNTIKSLSNIIDDTCEIKILVTLFKKRYLAEYDNYKNVSVKTLPLPAKIMEALLRLRLMLPIDLIVGEGIYVFPNYKNWPLWKSPSVTYFHDLAFMRYPQYIQPKNLKYLQKYIKTWAFRTQVIIAISEFTKKEIAKLIGYPYDNINVVYLGVNKSHFYRRSKEEIETAKKKYNITYDKYLLFVGNIEPRKNLESLVDAYVNLPKRLKKTYGLVLVGGDGWLNEQIIKTIKKLKSLDEKIFIPDKIISNQDLPAIYSGSDLFIQPSYYEGFSMTPLEAMSCSVPVLVSDIPPHREVVGDAGYYFRPESAKEMTNEIKKAIANYAQTQKKVSLGIKRSEIFTWENTAKQLFNVLDLVATNIDTRGPIIRRLIVIYNKCDLSIRKLLGENKLEPYRLGSNLDNKEEIKARLVSDYIDEEPNLIQKSGLVIYLRLRHIIASPVKHILKRLC